METDKSLLKVEVDPSVKACRQVMAAAEGILMTELVSTLIVERLETQTPTSDGPLQRP